jgi:flagellar hook-associated protein 1 FlgK
MLGLFGTLELGSRSLQNQRQGIEVTGHNIANADNPAFARQRLQIQTSFAISTPYGQQGTGAVSVTINRLRNELLDEQVRGELSVTAFLETQQETLQYAQSALGQEVDRQGNVSGVSVSPEQALSSRFNDFFAGLQSVAASPESMEERQALVMSAVQLATRFNLTDQRLAELQSQLNTSVQASTDKANGLLTEIADLNLQVRKAELGNSGPANDLRDLRQQRLEELSKLVKADTATDTDGTLHISVGGVTMVSGHQVLDRLQTYDAGGGMLRLRAETAGTSLDVTAGSIAAAMATRDGEVAGLRSDLNTLASTLITEVNAVHRAGFSLTGSTGADLFTGSGSSDIAVNASIVGNPALLQMSGVAGTVGNNQAALDLAHLADRAHAGLSNLSFSGNYSQIIGGLGHALASVNSRVEDQSRVANLLSTQRDSVSGVSLDEEMTNMMKYQKAFEASARLITVVEEMLDTVMNMKR